MLKNSERNCRPTFSVRRKSLSAPRSHVKRPGPIRTLRPVLPNVYGGGFTKQVMSNHSWMVCLPVERLPSHKRFGRVNVPVLAVGFASDTENGAPDCAVTMLVACHPPRNASAKRLALLRYLRPRPKGGS